MKKVSTLLTLICILSACLNTFAEPINWRIHVGGMYNILRTPLDRKNYLEFGDKFSFMGGVEIQVPLRKNWYIEPGLNLRYGPWTYVVEISSIGQYNIPHYKMASAPLKDFDKYGFYTGNGDFWQPSVETQPSYFVDMPIRAGWRLALNDKNEFQFSFGPYLSIDCGNPDRDATYGVVDGCNRFSIGLNPSVVYKHRALSLGISYQNPCIYNGPKNRETNTLLFTIGINFRGRKVNLDKLSSALEIAGSVLNTTADAMSSYYGNLGEDTSASSDNNSSSRNSVSTRATSSNTSKDRTSRNADYNSYFKYETTVIKIINGDDRVNKKSDIQRKMKALRKKWVDRGDGWNASPYETK